MNQTLKSTYVNAVKKYNVANEDLLNHLGDDLFTAPASTMTSLHNAFEGGLVDHLLRVAKFAVKINSILPESLQQPMESVMRVALLSEIGKVGIYTPCTSEWHRKNQGKMYEFVDNKVSMRVGQRSIYYLTQTGNKLSEVEYQAILTHDVNTGDDAMFRWHAEPLTVILRQAIELAIMDEKREK
jgi:hypothetical protein